MFNRFSMKLNTTKHINNVSIQHLGAKKMIGGLNSSMIGRIHNAKPGCSACGKKVA